MAVSLAPAIRPNLGCPALTKNVDGGAVFQAVFIADNADLDLKATLSGNLFVQQLSDTRVVIQDIAKASNFLSILKMAHWPDDIKNRLIPLEVVSFRPASERPVTFRGLADRACTRRNQYVATLRIPTEFTSRVELPQMFNLIQIEDPIGPCRINYHAVYVHEQNWHNFSFLHITDSHISLRHDLIQQVVRTRLGPDSAAGYVNVNQQFRDFIAYANAIHRGGLIDFIILTGDIVDYIGIEQRFYDFGADVDMVAARDNLELFVHFLIGWPSYGRLPISQELEVPIFTCPGNHDYRPLAYPLIGEVKLESIPLVNLFDVTVIPITDWEKFGLTAEEAHAYEPRATYGDKEAAQFVMPVDSLHYSYCGLLSPEPDYTITLAKHRILCLDTGPDAGVVTGTMDYLFGGGGQSRANFLANSPDSIGFTDKQITFIRSNMGTHDGLVILACHAPVLNSKTVLESYHGSRSPDYAYGVAANNFDAFVATLFRDDRKHADLILSGHTHNHCEFTFKYCSVHQYCYHLYSSVFGETIRYDIDESALMVYTGGAGFPVSGMAPPAPPIPGTPPPERRFVIGGRCYQIHREIFSDSLERAADKSLWWSHQHAYTIQTPSIVTYAGQSKTFDMLRVVVKNDIITQLQRLKIDEVIGLEPNILPWLSVLLLDDAAGQPVGQGLPWLSLLLEP